MLDIACLMYSVRLHYYIIDFNDYVGAMCEINRLAKSAGISVNDAAKIIVMGD